MIQKRLVVVGATGMVGGYALRYALDDPDVGTVTAIGRRKLGMAHPKLNAFDTELSVECRKLEP